MTDSAARPVGSLQAQPTAPAAARHVLQSLVGETPWSQVWQAVDTRSGADCRLKLYKTTQPLDAALLAAWGREIPGSGHLVHPAIVPVRDAGLLDGQPFLASAWHTGSTLEERIGSGEPVERITAVAWMVELLDALVLAHAAGVVHGRLKPSNLLIDPQGRIHLLDFAQGTEALGSCLPAQWQGTLAPWQAPPAAAGAAPTAVDDLYGLGMTLLRLLGGDVRLAADPLAMCLALHAAGVDAALLEIVRQQALALDPADRAPSAHALGARLQQWLDAAAAAPVRAALIVTPQESALDILLQRMQKTQDFPVMAHAVARILALSTSDTESVASVAEAILQDVALSSKLLRVVNSAYYARGGSIGTVSRAVSLIGLNGVRNLALGLVLLEGMRDKEHAALLLQEFLRALAAGTIARELAAGSLDSEAAFVGALFQDMGRLLTHFYFVPEALQIQALVRGGSGQLSEEAAAVRVLGLGFEALGLGVARLWDLPPEIQRCMRRPAGPPPLKPPVDATERMRWTTLAANELAHGLLEAPTSADQGTREQLQQRLARAIGATAAQLQDALERARGRLTALAAAMDLPVLPPGLVQRQPQSAAVAAAAADPGRVAPVPAQDRLRGLDAALAQGRSPERALQAGAADIELALGQGLGWGDIAQMVLETMHRSIGLSRTVFCLRDPTLDALTGRLGRGAGVEPLVQAFQVPLEASPADLFHAVCMRGADTLIADAGTARLAARLPLWYRKLAGAPGLLLLPLVQTGLCYGLVYADMRTDTARTLQEKELDLLRSLRAQLHRVLRSAD